MKLQKLIQKLELNETTVSTFFGGLVLVVVVVLMINYFGKDTVQPIESSKSDLRLEEAGYQETVNPDATATPEPTTGEISAASVANYTVKAGDSLWVIAQERMQNGYAWPQIAQANNLTAPYVLEEGQELDLPQGEALSTSSGEPAAAQVLEKPSNYMVKRGDSLWKVAEAFYGDGYRWVEIWQVNQGTIRDPDVILIGQLLELP